MSEQHTVSSLWQESLVSLSTWQIIQYKDIWCVLGGVFTAISRDTIIWVTCCFVKKTLFLCFCISPASVTRETTCKLCGKQRTCTHKFTLRPGKHTSFSVEGRWVEMVFILITISQTCHFRTVKFSKGLLVLVVWTCDMSTPLRYMWNGYELCVYLVIRCWLSCHHICTSTKEKGKRARPNKKEQGYVRNFTSASI